MFGVYTENKHLCSFWCGGSTRWLFFFLKNKQNAPFLVCFCLSPFFQMLLAAGLLQVSAGSTQKVGLPLKAPAPCKCPEPASVGFPAQDTLLSENDLLANLILK
ncbi:unnamed protein product [Rangifer tarandus platyrhynchus]|uniref:Uncharacterized protein n=1 Tax=Rangifer tarandus platyrhynchus TaxID=3082113 RepID=A0AC59ZGP0_RANTA